VHELTRPEPRDKKRRREGPPGGGVLKKEARHVRDAIEKLNRIDCGHNLTEGKILTAKKEEEGYVGGEITQCRLSR